MRIVVFNEGASAIFGYTKDKIIGQPLEVLIPRALPHDTPIPTACAASSSSA
jgi:PAS domain-containing protein